MNENSLLFSGTMEELTLIIPFDKEYLSSSDDSYSLKSGYTYMIKEDSPKFTYSLLRRALREDKSAMILTSMYPRKVEDLYGVEGQPIFWLSDTKGNNVYHPKRLAFEISQGVINFIKEKDQAVVLLDGFDYLVFANGFEKSVDFLKNMSDLFSTEQGSLLVTVNPMAFNQKETAILERTFDIVETKFEETT